MDPNTLRLAQLQHALNVAAAVPDPSHPEVQAYLHAILTADPAAVASSLKSSSEQEKS